MKLWIYTDGTAYSFPLYIEKTAERLAKKVGVSAGTVRKSALAFKNGEYQVSRYEVVEVDDDEDNDLFCGRYNAGHRRI